MSDEAEYLYQQGAELLGKDNEKAFEALSTAVMLGSINAKVLYAKLLHYDVERHDDEKAFKLFLECAQASQTEAQFFVGLFYFEGIAVDKNIPESIMWFRIAAEKGDSKSQFYLGMCYKNGWGVYRNSTQARRWLTLAMERGNQEAAYHLADIFSDINSTQYNLMKAVDHYVKASDDGISEAHYKAGMCFFEGKGTPKNFIRASTYFRRGVENENTDCFFMLGMMYDKGLGVSSDRKMAMKYLSSAVMGGSFAAKEYLDSGGKYALRINNIDDDQFDLECNTPDMFGGMEGAIKKRGFFSFLEKK